eukprot:1157327-Pelagomonas_calceolata.AAC.3
MECVYVCVCARAGSARDTLECLRMQELWKDKSDACAEVLEACSVKAKDQPYKRGTTQGGAKFPKETTFPWLTYVKETSKEVLVCVDPSKTPVRLQDKKQTVACGRIERVLIKQHIVQQNFPLRMVHYRQWVKKEANSHWSSILVLVLRRLVLEQFAAPESDGKQKGWDRRCDPLLSPPKSGLWSVRIFTSWVSLHSAEALFQEQGSKKLRRCWESQLLQGLAKDQPMRC